jgi:ABC-type nitrate/sulfonate/bicarbonate transport system permease component
MFVPIVTLGILGIVFTGIVALLEKRLVPWAGAVDRD